MVGRSAKPEVLRHLQFRLGTSLSPLLHFLGFSPVSLQVMGEDAPKRREEPELQYFQYEPAKEEAFLPAIRQLISKDLSEPYSIYVYRYFLYQWGDLCYMVWLLLLQSFSIRIRGMLRFTSIDRRLMLRPT